MVTAIVDNLLAAVPDSNATDPTPQAILAASTTDPAKVQAVAALFWSSYWNQSAICLPGQPEIERFWFGAQYIMACMSATEEVLERNKELIPPPGLYGPFVTSDTPSWHGDFTLDYNQEAQYYGVYSSNKATHAAPYFPPIEAWMDAARLAAQTHAQAANLTCPAHALHYACHLAPWGYQSADQSTYMHWNGNFAALLFINAWEYTRNETFAKEHTYPLLDGLNAWWGCFLQKQEDGTGGYVYHDSNTMDPDEEHENQKVGRFYNTHYSVALPAHDAKNYVCHPCEIFVLDIVIVDTRNGCLYANKC